METEQKFFMWYDSGHNKPIYGPYYDSDVRLIGGKRLFHAADDLMKINLSDSIKKRINSAKVGTKIKVSYLHRGGNLMLKRIGEDEMEKLKLLDKNYGKLTELNKEKYKLEIENESLTSIFD